MSTVEVEPIRGGSPALRVVQIGAIAVILAVTTFHAFELDRFFIPKELVVHLSAALAGLLAIRALWRMSVTRVDLLLAGYLGLSALSALLATNRWSVSQRVADRGDGHLRHAQRSLLADSSGADRSGQLPHTNAPRADGRPGAMRTCPRGARAFSDRIGSRRSRARLQVRRRIAA